MTNKTHIQLLRSNEIVSNEPKKPNVSSIDYGEIAVNYHNNNETLFMKNDNNNIVSFSSDNNYTEKKLGSAFTDTNKTVTELLNEINTKLNSLFTDYMRKPETVWEAEAGSGILASNSNIVENPNWHLTGLDFSPYKRLKFYIAPGGTSNTQFTPSVVLEMSLESRAVTTTYGYYTASIICQNPNDANRLYALNMCVSNTKDKVFFGRQNTLYGTAATSINEAPRYLYKIEGYFD